MIKYPKISVVIPSKNEEKNIAKAINGILLQSYPKDKIEIIVVDDKSSDKTREIVSSFKGVKVVDGPGEDEHYRIGQWTIIHKNGDVSVIKYPYDDYILDANDENTTEINPYMNITGSAGEYFRGYTDGILTLQAGVTETINIMNNQMPEELTLAAVKKAISMKWDNVSKLDFGTFQVEGKKVRK